VGLVRRGRRRRSGSKGELDGVRTFIKNVKARGVGEITLSGLSHGHSGLGRKVSRGVGWTREHSRCAGASRVRVLTMLSMRDWGGLGWGVEVGQRYRGAIERRSARLTLRPVTPSCDPLITRDVSDVGGSILSPRRKASCSAHAMRLSFEYAPPQLPLCPHLGRGWVESMIFQHTRTRAGAKGLRDADLVATLVRNGVEGGMRGRMDQARVGSGSATRTIA